MTGTTVERFDDTRIGESIVVFGNLAAQIAKTEFVPESFRNRPEAVLACMLFGREVGLGPMASLNLTQSIKGKVGLKPEGMRAVVQAHGHRIWTEEYGDDAVTLCGQRAGDERVERVRWTLDDAKRAKLVAAGDSSWSKYPRAMLLARATSELCRLLFSDVTGGIAYGPDELEEIAGVAPPPAAAAPVVRGAVVDVETGEVPAAKSRKRKPPTVDAEPAGRPAESRPATDEQKASIADLIDALKEQGDEWASKARDVWRERAPEKGVGTLFAAEADALEPALGALLREAVAASAAPTLDTP